MSIIIGVFTGSGFRVASRGLPLASQLSLRMELAAVWHLSKLPGGYSNSLESAPNRLRLAARIACTAAEACSSDNLRAELERAGVIGKLVATVRERHPFATFFLALFYIWQVRELARLVYHAFGLKLSLEPGFVLFVLGVLTWISLMWSLEAIRKWNRLGFFLYLVSCAAGLMLRWWASVEGIHVLRDFWGWLMISPVILWFFVLLAGSPTMWAHMDRHSLLRDLH